MAANFGSKISLPMVVEEAPANPSGENSLPGVSGGANAPDEKNVHLLDSVNNDNKLLNANGRGKHYNKNQRKKANRKLANAVKLAGYGPNVDLKFQIRLTEGLFTEALKDAIVRDLNRLLYNQLDVIVIVLEHEKLEIQQKLEKTQLKLKIDYCSLSGDSDVGTAEALRQISDRIKTDVVVVSCDTIIDVSLYDVLKEFRDRNASVVGLLMRNTEHLSSAPGPKIKYKSEQDLFGISSYSGRLVFMGSASDFENDFIVSGHLLRQNEEVELYSGLLDAHVYVLKRWILDFLETSSSFSTIKGELLPFIVKKQMSASLNAPNQHDKLTSEVNVDIKSKEIFEFVPFTENDGKICDSNIFSRYPNYLNDLIRCYAVLTPSTTFGTRVNTLPSFYAANQQICTKFAALTDINTSTLVTPSCDIKSAQVKQTTIADQVTIESGSSVVNSTVGSSCSIRSKASVSGSILMDNVTIGENVQLENCIVCEKSTINSGCVLRNCLIGFGYTVPANTKVENVHLSNSEGFMEI